MIRPTIEEAKRADPFGRGGGLLSGEVGTRVADTAPV